VVPSSQRFARLRSANGVHGLMRHSWQFVGVQERAQFHRCTRCGLKRKKLVPLDSYPIATYTRKDGSEVRGVAPKCLVKADMKEAV
jgi:hypothetical protein